MQGGVNFIFGHILPTISLLCLIFIRVCSKEDPSPFEVRQISRIIDMYIYGHKPITAQILKSYRKKMGLTRVIKWFHDYIYIFIFENLLIYIYIYIYIYIQNKSHWQSHFSVDDLQKMQVCFSFLQLIYIEQLLKWPGNTKNL